MDGQGQKCHTSTMIHSETGEVFKMNVHVSLIHIYLYHTRGDPSPRDLGDVCFSWSRCRIRSPDLTILSLQSR
jgi:hypothetical protein